MDDGKSSRESIEVELAERVGTLINERYRVLRVIGHGSTGAVYACQHVGLDKLVALKVLHREMEQNASFVDRFKLEAQAASRLEHPNSVRVLDFGQDQGTGALFIAMEYIEGRDLLQVLEEDGPFSAERAVDVMSQILDVLGVAHAAGIVHRDLKPENILLRTVETEIDGVTREHVTVCDFGIAQFGGRRPAPDGTGTNGTGTSGTGTSGSPDGEEGLVAGTPAYMSPEQARAEPQDARSDIYSAGVVLYQLLTLQLPFYSDDAYALALKHCVEVPPPPSRFGAVSPQLEDICLKALSKSRDARYQSAREMRQVLQRVLGLGTDGSLGHGHGHGQDGGKPRRWGLPRALAPQGTPSDAPAVEMLPAQASRSSAMLGKLWRYSVFAGVGVAFILGGGVLFTHNQDQRAIAAGPSTRPMSMVRPSRVQPSVQPKAAAAGSSSSVALPASAPPSRTETTYSPATTGVTGVMAAEVPEAQASVAAPVAVEPATAEVATDTSALAEVDALVGVGVGDGEGVRPSADANAGAAGANASKVARVHAEPSRPERRVNLPAGAQDKPGKETFAQRAERADKPASIAAADAPSASTQHHETAEHRPESRNSLDSLELVPDVPIDVSAAAVGAASALEASGAQAERAPKPVLVKTVLADPTDVAPPKAAPANDQAEARGPAPRAAASTTAPLASSANVSIIKIASRSGVSKSSVRTALNLTAITDCYRTALQSGGVSSKSVNGELELATSQSGSVTEASLHAPELPTPLRHCVEQIVRRGRVREADTGNAQATISLAFSPR